MIERDPITGLRPGDHAQHPWYVTPRDDLDCFARALFGFSRAWSFVGSEDLILSPTTCAVWGLRGGCDSKGVRYYPWGRVEGNQSQGDERGCEILFTRHLSWDDIRTVQWEPLSHLRQHVRETVEWFAGHTGIEAPASIYDTDAARVWAAKVVEHLAARHVLARSAP